MSVENTTTLVEEITPKIEEYLQYVTFKLKDEQYGVEVQKVQEIIRSLEVTAIPKSPDFMEGIVSLRGKVIPIINLRNKFGLPKVESDEENRVIVVEVGGTMVGLVVDSVSEILRLSSRDIEPPPYSARNLSDEYINGIGKVNDSLIILLDIDKVLSVLEREELALLKKEVCKS